MVKIAISTQSEIHPFIVELCGHLNSSVIHKGVMLSLGFLTNFNGCIRYSCIEYKNHPLVNGRHGFKWQQNSLVKGIQLNSKLHVMTYNSAGRTDQQIW